MSLSFSGAKYTGILLSRKKFLILVSFKHKLGSFKLVTLHLYLFLEPGAPVVLKIKVNVETVVKTEQTSFLQNLTTNSTIYHCLCKIQV